MARVARIVIPGTSHHVAQRGNNGQDVFFVADDRRVYLACLREQGARFGFRLTGSPLGSDSFLSKAEHLIGRRIRPLPIGRQKGWRKKQR